MDSHLVTIGNYQIRSEEIVTLLAKYQLLPQLWQQMRLDEAIATIEPTSEQIQRATQQWLQAVRLIQPNNYKLYSSNKNLLDRNGKLK
jgi:hypothetical protein